MLSSPASCSYWHRHVLSVVGLRRVGVMKQEGSLFELSQCGAACQRAGYRPTLLQQERNGSPSACRSEPEQAVRPSTGVPEESCRLRFCHDLVRSIPSVFNFQERSHPAFVLAATGKTLQLSRAAGKRPGAFEGDLSAGCGDPAFKNRRIVHPFLSGSLFERNPSLAAAKGV